MVLKRYWVHLEIVESLEASETFHVTVADDAGDVLLRMEDVVFRAVKPEQIQMAIASTQSVKDVKIYALRWSPYEEEKKEALSKEAQKEGLIITDTEISEISQLQELGTVRRQEDFHETSRNFDWILNVCCSSEPNSLEKNLTFALKLLQKTTSELIFATLRCQNASEKDLSGATAPLHAGLWGLARAARNEEPLTGQQ